jgi:hypothetical protein
VAQEIELDSILGVLAIVQMPDADYTKTPIVNIQIYCNYYSSDVRVWS